MVTIQQQFLMLSKFHNSVTLETSNYQFCFQKGFKSLVKRQNFRSFQTESINFADDKLKVTKMAKFFLDKIENIVGKEENAGYQHFLLFPQCFEKALSSGSLKVWIVW